MSKKIFIHVGTHKTGTSSFQKTIVKNAQKLKNANVKYINLYQFEYAQKLMALENFDNNLVIKLEQFINSRLEQDINSYIICCEYLSGNPKKLYSNVSVVAEVLYKSLNNFEEKKAFVVLRNQNQFIQSIYTQYIHQSENYQLSNLIDETKLEGIKWCGFLKKYESVFGENNVFAIPYDKEILNSRNKLSYFSEFSKINILENLDEDFSNIGYNKEAVKIAEACNPHLNSIEKKTLRSLLQENFNKGVFSEYKILDTQQKNQIDNYFKDDNLLLFQTYFKNFSISSFSENIINKEYNNTEFKETASNRLIVILLKELNRATKKNNAKQEFQFQDLIVLSKKIVKKILGKSSNRALYPDFQRNTEFKERFSPYDKAVILGSSSSINKLDVTRFSNDLVITVGNFYEHPLINEINPKAHIFAASHPPITTEVLENWWNRCNEVLPSTTILLIEKRDKLVAEQVFKNREVYYYSYGGNLPVDFTKPIKSPWSVTIVALQLAIYCKVKTIGLLGINHDWQCIKPYTHFYSHNKPSLEYYLKAANIEISYEKQKQPFPKERLYREYELYQQYEALKKEAERLHIDVFNYDPFSDFDVFERKNISNLTVKNKDGA
ncbi:hypothetical protein [Winogradskyella endarachnes]|uniref:DUF115 domain-containing protein n=1 Tax=Winogradskyella endarachnes TaxID=2681965 RepID=A0A6L6U608_9FLAO|nr:hypothetical protein [Winogradskyella endarachnes]MUU77653.1 hypothetical protein [Winogradskyella endarachnes]